MIGEEELHLGAGVFATLGSAVLLPDTIGVGASGALMGLLGAWLADLVVRWGAPAVSAAALSPRSPACC
jgi:hypothetical protein